MNGLDPELETFLSAVTGKKAYDVMALDVRDLTTIADVFIFCSGTSNRQVTAIADHIQRYLKKNGIKVLSAEGKSEGQWVLLDYGHIIIHVFLEPVRQFYDIESIWSDARKIDVEPFIASAAQDAEKKTDNG